MICLKFQYVIVYCLAYRALLPSFGFLDGVVKFDGVLIFFKKIVYFFLKCFITTGLEALSCQINNICIWYNFEESEFAEL